MDNLVLYNKVNMLPDELIEQVSAFIDNLLKKNNNKPEDKKPVFGSAKGMIHMSADFDEPLEDFKDYM